jgi:hypothetical protein
MYASDRIKQREYSHARLGVVSMSLTEVLLQELESADDAFLRGAIEWVRHQKRQPAETLAAVLAIEDEFNRVAILGELAVINSYYFSAALEAARLLKVRRLV